MKKINWESLRRNVPDWYQDVKFGLFFHWGPYSVPAYMNEWYSRNMYMTGMPQNIYHTQNYGQLKDFGYKDFYREFTGKYFDPEEWAEMVVRSGAKYAGPVAEHADNFSMWDSKVNPVNSVNYGPKRDVFGECTKAFRDKGIYILAPFHHQWLWGWFMSTDADADVYIPENEKFYGPALPIEAGRMYPYRRPDQKFNQTWFEKIKEVIDFYSPDILYFDSRAFIIDEEYRYRMLHYYYKDTNHTKGVITYKGEDFPQNVGVLDMERGCSSEIRSFVWQTDDRLEDNITWCYVQKPKYKSARKIIQQLCDNVSKNGNLLLNIGPDREGRFPEEAKRELYKIGKWLQINGEAIYGTRPWIISSEGNDVNAKDIVYGKEEAEKELRGENVILEPKAAMGKGDYRFTQNRDYIYAIFFEWPEDGHIQIKSLASTASGLTGMPDDIALLGYDGMVRYRAFPEYVCILLPKKKPCEEAYVIRIKKEGTVL